ncbi:hypothetical protein ABNQ39_07205 [Azospirillum sp. A26]|uniref:hypothetical protein n=1 Tax=Azospirillum sp. A26 TaxID=3160607 RepID=UPI00367006C8
MTDAAPAGPINSKSVGSRLGISAASKVITLDGVEIGTLTRASDEGRMVWVAHLTDVQGHRGGLHQNGSLQEVIKLVTIKVTDILRRYTPNADWGPLSLDASPGEMREIGEGARTVLRYPFGPRYSKRACYAGRKVLALVFGAAKHGRTVHEGSLVSVRKITRAEALAADRLLEFRHPRAKHFAEVAFTLSTPATAPTPPTENP